MTNEDAHDAIVFLLKHLQAVEVYRVCVEDGGDLRTVPWVEAQQMLQRIAEGPCPRCSDKNVILKKNEDGTSDVYLPPNGCERCKGTGKAGT